MKRSSKFVGKTYQNWTVTKIYLAANYAGGTRHNAYRYMLERVTSDRKCFKKITVSGPTMTKISRGLVDIERLANRKGRRKTNYQFILEKLETL